jgi:REP element-mobilizing transposase RayT
MLNRKSNRLPHQKLYTTNNSFFTTICVKDRVCCLSDIDERGNLINTNIGSIVENTWLSIGDFFENIGLEEFVVMPNHFHGIITFYDKPISSKNNKIVNLSDIMGWFKAYSQKIIRERIVGEGLSFPHGIPSKKKITQLQIDKNGRYKIAPTNFDLNKIWQKSFYDHIIRGEKDLRRIQEYIIKNPIKWKQDILNPKNETKFQTWQHKW